MSSTGKAYISTSLPGLLTVIFVVLKLCKVISWSWIWILSPAWISFTLGVIVVAGFIFYDRWQWKRKWENSTTHGL